MSARIEPPPAPSLSPRPFVWLAAVTVCLIAQVGCRSHTVRLASRQEPRPAAPPLDERAALQALVKSATGGRPFDGAEGLAVATPSGVVRIPLEMHGFAWTPADVNQILFFDWPEKPELRHHHWRPGVGTPVVVVRRGDKDEPHYRDQQPFAATAILGRAARPASGDPAADHPYVLALFNPATVTEAPIDGRPTPIAGDHSLAIEYALQQFKSKSDVFTDLLRPEESKAGTKLMFVEPYQPGKIPAVFVHGLAADALTWIETLNDLSVDREFLSRYQVWGFRYPTGRGFLESAAELREKLLAVREELDPEHRDPALDQMVLVGHSMGGLLSKLQVTTSSDRIWREISSAPFSEFRAPPEIRDRLARNLFFEPVPSVKRVVFIGTPHRGASLASRPIGRITSSAVTLGGEEASAYRRMVLDNYDHISPWFWRRQPTSIDMLTPGNPILDGLFKLPVAEGVKLHSVIGVRGLLVDGRSDGVVSIESARHPRVESETYVAAEHSGLQSHSTTVAELLRIFAEHAHEFETVEAASNRR